MIWGNRGVPLSGCLASASAAAAAQRASSIWRGDMLRRVRFHAAMAGGTVDVDHRGSVLVRREGERTFPVERILGGDRLVERRRASGRVVAFLAPEPQSVAGLKVRRSIKPAQPGRRATPALTRMRLTWMRPRQGPKPWSLTIITAAPRFSASSQSCPIASSRPRITWAAALFHSGRSMPVSSTFKIGPDAVLERVEVLELDHQHRPVGDELVGEHSLRERGPGSCRRSVGRYWSALRAIEAPVSRSSPVRSRCLGLEPGGELGCRRERGLEMGRVHARDDDSAHLERRIHARAR